MLGIISPTGSNELEPYYIHMGEPLAEFTIKWEPENSQIGSSTPWTLWCCSKESSFDSNLKNTLWSEKGMFTLHILFFSSLLDNLKS